MHISHIQILARLDALGIILAPQSYAELVNSEAEKYKVASQEEMQKVVISNSSSEPSASADYDALLRAYRSQAVRLKELQKELT